MPKHLQHDIDALSVELAALAGMVEDAVNNAIRAVVDRKEDRARTVIVDDRTIDLREVHIEEECLKMLALHQPVAADLRFIVTALKVNNDLERMGDLAANIADRAVYLATHEPLEADLDLPAMAKTVKDMLRAGLNALTRLDVNLARTVLTMDGEVDEMNRQAYTILQGLMESDPGTIRRAIHILSISRHLERIADLTTNIAEDVIYMVNGEVVRHQCNSYDDQT
jgi:phosphate transport system protein